MTKKDFELIAACIECASFPLPPGTHPNYAAVIREAFARYMADGLADTNPRFDRARFLKACGVAS